MNHREPPHSMAGTHRALRCSALLLSMMAPLGAHALPPTLLSVAFVSRTADPIPYLPVNGAPPLRFQEPVAAPDSPPRRNANSSSASNPDTTVSTDPAHDITPAVAPTRSPLYTASAEKPVPLDSSNKPARSPAPILPDETRPTVQPEDFLPYFQIPGSARRSDDVTLLVPVPKAAPAATSLPTSSATYTQTPK